MGKKGKKDKGKEDKRGKKGKKGVKGLGSKKPSIAKLDVVPVIKTKGCLDKVEVKDPCRYTVEACCKEEILCKPHQPPGVMRCPQTLAVAGSESGSYDSVCKLLRAGFLYADRVLAMCPWGNYVVFRSHSPDNKVFFLYDGCTCNLNRFRYLDLNCGTAGLLYFDKMYDILNYIIRSRDDREFLQQVGTINIDEVCTKSCKF